MSAPANARENYFYIDLLRAMAAVAVVIIHVIGPYRGMLGHIPTYDWLTAVGFNVAGRWAVPVFIMITGALMLSDKRPFDLKYYLSRRVTKVVVPFLAWSVIYALLAGVSFDSQGFIYNSVIVWECLEALPGKATWYHLGFYYYFIPLYLVIPFLTPWVQALSDDQLKMLVLGWLFLTVLYMIRVDSDWMTGVVMYGGYLPLGYALTRIPLTSKHIQALVAAGCVALLGGLVGVWELSSAAGQYYPGRYTSYKTINTVTVATMIFALAHHYGHRITSRFKNIISYVGRYSLGLYLVHPLVLWPVRHFEVFPGFTVVTVPLMAALVIVVSLFIVQGMGCSKATAWLVP